MLRGVFGRGRFAPLFVPRLGRVVGLPPGEGDKAALQRVPLLRHILRGQLRVGVLLHIQPRLHTPADLRPLFRGVEHLRNGVVLHLPQQPLHVTGRGPGR